MTHRTPRIGITDVPGREDKYEPYESWLRRFDPGLEVVRLSQSSAAEPQIAGIHGIVLTGGGDVDPTLFGEMDANHLARRVDHQRDEFELEVIDRALDADLPLLGICRGMQVMNVYLGGTLVLDLPTEGYEDHAGEDGKGRRHTIGVLPHSLAEVLLGRGEHEVNSFHHQAIDHPGQGLLVSARSRDGVIEAAEWALKDDMPFLLLVQWHPERLADIDHPCSRGLALSFLREVQRMSSHRELSSHTAERSNSQHG